MLEKMFGCTLISKLRAILLMEADFNFSNKLVYGVRMMDNVRKHGMMPEEIYSEKGRTADDEKSCFTTLFARLEWQQGWAPLMQPTVMTASRTPSPCSCSKPLEFQKRR
jgi:hypothetical protein